MDSSTGASSASGSCDRLRRRAGDLDVGGVARGQRDVVLARRTGRHVLVRAGAAHHPDVGLDPVPLEPAAIEDLVVGLAVLVVADVQARRVAVERVGVLHDELARAQHAGARARLVALLDLEVVEDLRQVAVGAHDLRDVGRDDLLVRHRQHHVRAAAVLEPEQLAADRVVAAARCQSSAGLSTGISISWPPIASISSRTICTAFWCTRQPAGQPAPQAGADLPDHPGAHQQLVRERLRVGGGLLLGREEVLAQTRHRGAKPSGTSQGDRTQERQGSKLSGGSNGFRSPAAAVRLRRA